MALLVSIQSSCFQLFSLLQAGRCFPFAPILLQNLQHYYGSLRPCAPPRYSHTRGASTGVSPLTAGRQVPTFHIRACIKFTPSSCRRPSGQLIRCPPDLSQGNDYPSVLTSSLRFRHVSNGSLAFVSLILT